MQPGLDQDQRQHRRGRGLAVRAADSDRRLGVHDRGQEICPAEHGDAASCAATTSRFDVRDGRRDRHDVDRTDVLGAWPTCTSTPSARSRSREPEVCRSLPDTRWPIVASTVAIALIPAPPMPTMCTRAAIRPGRSTADQPLALPRGAARRDRPPAPPRRVEQPACTPAIAVGAAVPGRRSTASSAGTRVAAPRGRRR